MASRNLTVDNTEITTEDVLKCMFSNSASEDSPITLTAVAVELGVENADILTALENVDEDFVDSDAKGNLWFVGDYENEEDMLADYAEAHTPDLPKADKIADITPELPEKAVEPVVMASWENPSHESHMIPFTTTEEIHDGFTRMPVPEHIPPCPEGVNPNFYELAWTAPTQAAKRHWIGVCLAQRKAFLKAEEVTPTPEPETKEYAYATDENGMPVL
jgi:hypothetical protein